MDYEAIKREIEHLEVLLSIKADEDEDALVLLLLGFVNDVLQDENDEKFKRSVLGAISDSLGSLYPNEDYSALIRQETAIQSGFLGKFIQDFNNGKLSEAMARFRARQYAGVIGKFKQMVHLEEEGENILTWRWTPHAEHCDDCRNLNGQSKPASSWKRLGIYPKSPALECYQSCRCVLS